MLQYNGEEYFWDGRPASSLRLDELSDEERYEFLCAIAPHDPVDASLYASAPTGLSARTGE